MIRRQLAIGASKLTKLLISAFRLGAGTSLPGKVARWVDPNILGQLATQIRQETLAVTGTNGKTTTCGLLAAFLHHGFQDVHVVHNQLGANMVAGITAALIDQASVLGKINGHYGVLEVDEASLPGVSKEVTLNRLVVTNLFRDQLDRYGELDTTAQYIRAAFPHIGSRILLNADDPLVAAMALATDRDVVTYGVEEIVYQYPVTPPVEPCPVPYQREIAPCPRCQVPLVYDRMFYGHLGHYHCPQCEYRRPTPHLVAESILVEPTGSSLTLRIEGEPEPQSLYLPLPGVFNVYNALAALAAMVDLGFTKLTTFQKPLNEYHSVFGRAERRKMADAHGQLKSMMVLLIKNPTGASEVVKLVAGDPKGRLMIGINDHYADGRDISWLWDAMFEWLPRDTGKEIVLTGRRATDMAVRLKYAGLPPELIRVEPNLEAALNRALTLAGSDETLYFLPTYTLLLQFNHQYPGGAGSGESVAKHTTENSSPMALGAGI